MSFENTTMFASTFASCSSMSLFLFWIAIVFIVNGNFYSSNSISCLVLRKSASKSCLSWSPILLVPGGHFAASASNSRLCFSSSFDCLNFCKYFGTWPNPLRWLFWLFYLTANGFFSGSWGRVYELKRDSRFVGCYYGATGWPFL